MLARAMRRWAAISVLVAGVLLASGTLINDAGARAARPDRMASAAQLCAADARALKRFAQQTRHGAPAEAASLRVAALRLAARYEQRHSHCATTLRIPGANHNSSIAIGGGILRQVPTLQAAVAGPDGGASPSHYAAGFIALALLVAAGVFWWRTRSRPVSSGS
jgi:heme A synthase